VDFSPVIVAQDTGESLTNFLDLKGRTNSTLRFYRVRLAP
jgi:hypothetical protein